jgi:hypothetical protein
MESLWFSLHGFLLMCGLLTIGVQVLSANRGGLVVLVEGLRGFVPFSQITAVSVMP